MNPDDPLQWPLAVLCALGGLIVAMALAFLRMLRGPTGADRVAALDMMSNLVVGLIAVYAIVTDRLVLLDAAIALAIVTFLATVGFARYVEWGGTRNSHD
ncbi:cation:proton antiporter [Candidatus Nitrospira bockiana]